MRGAVASLVLLASCGRWNFDARSDASDDSATNPCGFHQVAAGNGFACALDRDGSVWCWGSNDRSEIVMNGGKDVLVPVQIDLPAPAVQIALGRSFACARFDDGRVWCWGENGGGQIGIGAPDPSPPTEIMLGADRAIDLGVGGEHACIRRESDQSIVCWGENRGFALGNAGAMIQPPTLVAGTAGTKALTIGHRHNCGIDAQDRPFCWGRGRTKQLGDGTIADRATPGFIPSVPTATSIGGGNRLTCAVEPSGDVRCFGARYHGGSFFDDYPTTPLVSDGVDVALGEYRGCARRTDKTVACWGYVTGDGIVQLSDTAIPMQMTNVTQLDGGFYHWCAITNGEAVCWGSNARGELGRGTRTSNPGPVVSSLSIPITQLAIGSSHACAISGGKVMCWGVNYNGELGTGAGQPSSFVPVEVTTGITQSLAGISPTCAWGAGTARCWGPNDGGRLGDGNTSGAPSPPVTIALVGATRVELGNTHGCASTLTDMSCWGENDSGQLGDTTNNPSATPVLVNGVTNPVSFSIRRNSVCAVDDTGVVKCWGENVRGELGDGTTMNRNTPVTVPIPTATAVERGDEFTCALAAGDVYCWGANETGQLGVGDRIDRLSPVQVTLPGPATSLTTGLLTTCVQLSNGDVYCWGRGGRGENAGGDFFDVTTPTKIPALAGATLLELGDVGGCAVVNGEFTCWGHRVYLGNGDDSETRPQPIIAPSGCSP